MLQEMMTNPQFRNTEALEESVKHSTASIYAYWGV